MAGLLGVDFGTSNTVLAVWDPGRREGVPYQIPDFGRFNQFGNETVSIVPSLIHYAADGQRWIGNQVLQRNLYPSDRTFRWMKRYISRRSSAQIKLDGQSRSSADAARDFLSAVLGKAKEALHLTDEPVAFSAPVEAYEHYLHWLNAISTDIGLPRFCLLDEPSAAALGYGLHLQPGQVHLIFDFGGGTLDVSVFKVESDSTEKNGHQHCRILGKAGTDLGGATLDQWIYEEVLRQNQRSESDADVRCLSRQLLVECETAKERLSSSDRAFISVSAPEHGTPLVLELSRQRLEELLDEHEAFAKVDRTIRRALNCARERGFTEDDIQSALMVGGTSLMPCVQNILRRIFGRDRVQLNRPLDAVARGAAVFVSGGNFFDYIQHDYAIRYVNTVKGEYDYRVIVKKGTLYPSREPLARLVVKATHDGQTELGIALFELGVCGNEELIGQMELVFDPSGAARILQAPQEEIQRRSHFWINENAPAFLTADPPARKGEPRFELIFSLDCNKRLLMSGKDLRTGRRVWVGKAVVQLV